MAAKEVMVRRTFEVGSGEDVSGINVSLDVNVEVPLGDRVFTISNSDDDDESLSIAASALPDLIAALQEFAKDLPNVGKK